MNKTSLEEVLENDFDGDLVAFLRCIKEIADERRGSIQQQAAKQPSRVTPDTPVVVELKNVNKEYKLSRKNKVSALSNVNLSIYEGEIVAITGPSGSGKSTLLQLIGGIDTPTSGDIVVDGQIINKLSQRKLAKHRLNTIGFVFQFFYLQPFLNVSKNIEVPLMFAKAKRKSRKESVEKVLSSVGTDDRAKHLPKELSGGQMQRVAIARALVNNPKVILADEPTGNLDSANGRNIISLLQKIRDERNTTIIIVTHDPSVANAADRIIKVSDGAVT